AGRGQGPWAGAWAHQVLGGECDDCGGTSPFRQRLGSRSGSGSAAGPAAAQQPVRQRLSSRSGSGSAAGPARRPLRPGPWTPPADTPSPAFLGLLGFSAESAVLTESFAEAAPPPPGRARRDLP